MKRSLTLVCVLASGLGASAFAQTAATDTTPNAPGVPAAAAPAAPAGPAKVGVIMFEQAVGATNEGQRDFSELQKKFEPKQTEIKTKSDEIDSLKKQLQAESATLTDDQKAIKAKAIDDKEKALQRLVEDAKADFQTEGGEIFNKLEQQLGQVMVAYAQQNGFTVVLDASQPQQQQQQQPTVLWANQQTDITYAVIQAYNAKYNVPPPAAGSTTPRTTAPRPTPKPAAPAPK